MEDDASILLDGKTLANLRVVDLKLELEKRGLSKSGSKKDLVKRLKQQLEFEKLSQRKSTGDCELKIELDADTEQNEFVQQYLAQQQKIYAQQKEVKRQVELEEIQKSGDEKESCDSAKGDEEDESESEPKNQKADNVEKTVKISLPPDKTTKDEVFEEAVHPVSSSSLEKPSKNHVAEDKHSSDTHKAKEQFKEVEKDREKELSTAISSLLTVENTPNQDVAEDLSVTVKPDVRDIENDREKELSTAISSLLSVENSNKQVDEAEDLSVTVPDSGVIRTSHDDDREKDLATAVLSSLLVDQDVETKNDEYVAEPCDDTPLEVAVAPNSSAVAEETSQVETEIVTEVKSSPAVKDASKMKTEVAIKAKSSAGEESSKMETVVDTVEKSSSGEDTLHTKTEVTIKAKSSSAVEESSQMEIEDVCETKSSPNVEDTLQMKTEVAVKAKSSSAVEESSEMETEVDTAVKSSVVDDTLQMKTEAIIKAKSSSVIEESSQMETDISQVKLNIAVEPETSSAAKETTQIEPEQEIEDKSSSGIKNTSLGCSSEVAVVAKSSACVEETTDMDCSVVNVNEAIVKDGDKSFNVGSPSSVQEPSVESSENSQGIQEEVSSKMNVSSVPYSLSDIQLPDSPATNVKPQAKSDSESEEEQASTNIILKNSKKAKSLEEGDMNGKATKPDIRERTSEDLKQGSDNEKTHQSKVPEVINSKKSKEVQSDSSSEDDKVKLKDKGRRKKYDSSDENRSLVKKSSESSKSRRKRNRSSSVEDRGRSRSKSPRGSKSSRRGRRRSASSEKEHKSKSKHKKSGSKKEKSKKRDKRSPSSDGSPLPHRERSPRKPYKVRRKERSVSSDEERHSKTRRESPKKDAKVSRKERSVSSGEEYNSKTRKESPKKDVKSKDRSVSSSDERNSRTRCRESPKKDARLILKDTSVSSGDERKSRTRNKESPKKVIEVSRSEKSISPEKDKPSHLKNKDSDAMEIEPSSQKEKFTRDESPEKEATKTSRAEQSPKKVAQSESETSSSGSSPQKISHTTGKDTIKEQKRKHSASSDDDSKRTENLIKRPRPTTPEDSREPKESAEKMDCESSKDEPPASRRSRRDGSPNSKQQAKRTDSSRSRSPEKVSKDNLTESRSYKRPPSPKGTRESIPEKADAKDSKKVSKDTPKKSSDGELPSSKEGSPARKRGTRKPSTESPVSRSSTMIVIRKEVPKQKLKIKRDNVIVVKKEKEDAAEENKSTTETPEPIENQKLEPGECPDIPPNTNYVRRKIVLSSRKKVEKPSDEPATKKSKWGSFAASRKAKQTVSISTDSLKNWFPDFKLLKEPEMVPEDLPSPATEEHDVEMIPVDKVTEALEPKMIAITRRLEPLPAEAELKPPPEPMNDDEQGVEPTPILFVQNLVRPFTLLQLKELLGETGKLVEDGFWIDKIKSKCFVTYETVEEAVKTRKILNGARWPMSNPKILAVRFATEKDLASHRSGLADQPKPRPPSPLKEEQPTRREREGRTRMVVPMREWDKDKMTQDSPEKHDRRREEERLREKEKKESKKRGGAEDTPAKLLDDLFQKTKTAPCIYWLPLGQEQIKERDERRKQVNQERDRRNLEREQENKRPRSRQRLREKSETRRSTTRSPVTRRR